MKLTAKVTEVISGSEARNGQQRVKLKVAEADSMFKSLIVANDGLALDDKVTLLVLTQAEVIELNNEFARESGEVSKWYPGLNRLRDQIRPDPPVPFLTDDEFCKQEAAKANATTQEFRQGGAA